MPFFQYDVPIAYSMVALADELPQTENHLFGKFLCYWAAFNDIYTTIAKRKGNVVKLRRRKNGSVKTESNGHVKIPKVDWPSERKQIELAFDEFSETLKDDLIKHPNTRFFLERTPKWQGNPIEFGYLDQKLNGVLNVGHTIDVNYPVWSPIDEDAFSRYINSSLQGSDRDLLAKQILCLIYTIRNNTFHGGKNSNEANDLEVVKKALPLLSLIIAHFIYWSPPSVDDAPRLVTAQPLSKD